MRKRLITPTTETVRSRGVIDATESSPMRTETPSAPDTAARQPRSSPETKAESTGESSSSDVTSTTAGLLFLQCSEGSASLRIHTCSYLLVLASGMRSDTQGFTTGYRVPSGRLPIGSLSHL
jgi:hypothetical protein